MHVKSQMICHEMSKWPRNEHLIAQCQGGTPGKPVFDVHPLAEAPSAPSEFDKTDSEIMTRNDFCD